MKRAYPRLMAACAMLAMLISNGPTITGLSVFDVPLLKEFGFSPGALKFRDLITLVLTGVVTPFIGILIDRVGARALLIAGSILLSLAYLAYSQVTALWQIYAIHVVFAAVLVATGLNVAVMLLGTAGKILGTITAIDAAGGGPGIWLIGVFHDHASNYRLGFTACATHIALTFLASMQFRNERKARLDLAAQVV